MRRLYPDRPVVAVGAIIFRKDKVLLVKRKVEPYAGKWSIPGGAIELGESAEAALRREVEEETALEVEPLCVVDVYDSIHEAQDRIQYHYTIVDYLCRHISGIPSAGTDVEEAQWVSLSVLGGFETTPLAKSAIAKALEMREEYED